MHSVFINAKITMASKNTKQRGKGIRTGLRSNTEVHVMPMEQSQEVLRREEREDRIRREEREDRIRREEREDRIRREEREIEREEKEKDRKLELEKLKLQNSKEANPNRKSLGERKKFDRYTQKFTNNTDADAYFVAFEGYAHREGWKKDTWVRRMSQCLEGKARDAMNNITTQDFEYDQLKIAVLDVFQLSSEAYRNKFKKMQKLETETIKSYIIRLGRTFDSWVKYSEVQINSDDAKKLSQLMIRDQVLQNVPLDMRKHLMQSKTLDTLELANEAAEYASLDPNYWTKNKSKADQNSQREYAYKGPNKRAFQAIAGNSRYNNQAQSGFRGPPQKRNRMNYPQQRYGQNLQTNQQRNANPQQQNRPNPQANQQRNGNKFPNTNRGKHNAYRCEQVQQVQDHIQSSVESQQQELRPNKFLIPGTLEGKEVLIYRDSGCNKTAVNQELIPDDKLTGRTTQLKGIEGPIEVPTASVYIECQRYTGQIEVAVIEDLDYDILLGRELDSWDDLTPPKILVLTRAQKQQQVQQEIVKQAQLRQYQTSQNETPQNSQDAQNEIDEQMHQDQPVVNQEVHTLLQGDVHELIKLQSNDPTLEEIRDSLVTFKEAQNYNTCYYKDQNGIMMRKCPKETRLRKQVEDQIILPKQYRNHVMEIAHDKAGHLGILKTTDRITQNFYWPKVNQNVRDHCKSCVQCQFMSKTKKSQKQLARPLPVIDIPFKRIGIDIKGPFAVTEKGNKYILVICDYATRYPEAIPIPETSTDTVTQAMIEVFSRVGLPSEIIHDQGSQFMSKLMANLCKRLEIAQIPATPYHQQTNGLTERFIGTLQSMINSLPAEQKENWDRYIPLFLFSYREVPSQFTGYSPFHLLYGRQVRGPLSLIKDNFLNQDTRHEISSNLLEIMANMTKWMGHANVNKQKSQEKMEKHYNKNAQDREYKVGEKVLVFLPVGAGKLDSKWQGPYEVTQKVGEVNYQIHMPDKRKVYRTLHANLIKKYYTRQQAQDVHECFCVTGLVQEIGDESLTVDHDIDSQFLDDSIGPCYEQTQTWQDVKIDQKLSKSRGKQIETVLEKHSRAFSDVPGKTHVITHEVKTTNETPIRHRAYRTPQSLKQKIKDELDSMLKLGVIEETNSAYASPIVVVPKPNGDIRVTTDYRSLNKITVPDPYEIPRIDQILDDVAKAKYITTLDLTKGFYQVPLDPQAKAKSAFVTPFGAQYAYNVMPFGMMNASATFQRLVDTVLKDCKPFCRQYIDDVAIFSDTWEDHLKHLDTVLTKIQDAGLTIKPSKSKMAYQEVTYLGHTIGNCKIKPMLDKVESVKEFPTPTTKKNVRSFLGLTGYYRKFVQGYDGIARPMIELTKKAAPKEIKWTPQCQTAFDTLKAKLSTDPVLVTPDFTKEFLLQTDASKNGIGAVLSQINDNSEEHPIFYLSRKMLPNELNYSVAEKECLAIVWSINKLRYYLQGHKFTVVTDHKALIWLDKTRNCNNRLMRWSLTLQQFTFNIQYRRGVTNTNADSLSRRE